MGIKVYRKDELPLKPDAPGAAMWAVGLDKAMLTYFELAPGACFPEHSHEAEQITMVLEGELTFEYGPLSATLKAGDVIAIPSNASHSARAGGAPCRAVDAWSPPRRDFLGASFSLRRAVESDMPFIRERIAAFGLDGDALGPPQFVVAVEGGEIVGFGRVRATGKVMELCSVGVVEGRRRRGVGRAIVERLVADCPSDVIHLATATPGYFERLGFRTVTERPSEIVEKIERVCAAHSGHEAVVMALDKNAKPGG